MDESHGQVTSDAARIYESFFVPALFGQWPAHVAKKLALAESDHVLDVACGTGVMAREAVRHVGAGRVHALDRNEGMLSVAREIEPRVEWRLGQAESLPYAEASFDAVASLFGLMFFEDRVAALSEMWRVLKPGGRLAVATWSSLDESPGYAAMVALLARLFGDQVANELRAPFVLGQAKGVTALFDRASIHLSEIARIEGTARFSSIDAWVHTDVRGWTLADQLDDEQYQTLLTAARTELRPYVTGEGVRFDSPALLAFATKR